MDEQQELLPQRAPLLPTGVPNGVHEARRSNRSGGQTRQVPQRRGHEDPTPMLPHGFGTAHAVRVDAQVPLTVLIKRFRRPALPRQTANLGGVPVPSVRHQHDMAARQRLALETTTSRTWPRRGEAHPPRKPQEVGAPTFTGDTPRPVSAAPDLPTAGRGPSQLQRPALASPQVSWSFPQAVGFDAGEPLPSAVGPRTDQRLGQGPGIAAHHARALWAGWPLPPTRPPGPCWSGTAHAGLETQGPGATPGPPVYADDGAPCCRWESGRSGHGWATAVFPRVEPSSRR